MNLEVCRLCPNKACCLKYSAFLQGYNTMLIQHQPEGEITLGQSVDIGGKSVGTIQLVRLLDDGVIILGVKRDFVDKLLAEPCEGEMK